jgi:hypothetical protein
MLNLPALTRLVPRLTVLLLEGTTILDAKLATQSLKTVS